MQRNREALLGSVMELACEAGESGYPLLETGLDLLIRKRQQQGNTYGANIGEVTLAPGIGLVEHVYSGTRQYLRVTLHPSDNRRDWIV